MCWDWTICHLLWLKLLRSSDGFHYFLSCLSPLLVVLTLQYLNKQFTVHGKYVKYHVGDTYSYLIQSVHEDFGSLSKPNQIWNTSSDFIFSTTPHGKFGLGWWREVWEGGLIPIALFNNIVYTLCLSRFSGCQTRRQIRRRLLWGEAAEGDVTINAWMMDLSLLLLGWWALEEPDWY